MERSFDLLEQLGDVVEAEAGSQRPEVPRLHREGRTRPARRRPGEPPAERVVDDLAEGEPRLPGQRLQLRGDVIVERDRGPHVMML